jgi:transcription antitermination factor NusG
MQHGEAFGVGRLEAERFRLRRAEESRDDGAYHRGLSGLRLRDEGREIAARADLRTTQPDAKLWLRRCRAERERAGIQHLQDRLFASAFKRDGHPLHHQFQFGERVKITDGPFANLAGNIDKIDADRGKLEVSVDIFGRSTPVELEFWQVERDDRD